MGVEDDAVDAEVIADLQNRIKETQKDIQVNLTGDATVKKGVAIDVNSVLARSYLDASKENF